MTCPSSFGYKSRAPPRTPSQRHLSPGLCPAPRTQCLPPAAVCPPRQPVRHPGWPGLSSAPSHPPSLACQPSCSRSEPITTQRRPRGVPAGRVGARAQAQPPHGPQPARHTLEKFGGMRGNTASASAVPRVSQAQHLCLLSLDPCSSFPPEPCTQASHLPTSCILVQEVKSTFSCPHADQAGSQAAVPSTPFSSCHRPRLWSLL